MFIFVAIVTCTCHPYMSTNWFVHPPYVRKQVATNDSRYKFNGIVTPIGGIFPPILLSAVKTCCGTCLAGSGSSSMDFKYDGHGNKAQKAGLHDVKDKIDGKSFISFPIGGTKDQDKYVGVGGEYEFVSIMDMPGAAFLVADRRDIHREVLNAILGCWPTVIFVFIVAYLAGAAIWLIVSILRIPPFPPPVPSYPRAFSILKRCLSFDKINEHRKCSARLKELTS